MDNELKNIKAFIANSKVQAQNAVDRIEINDLPDLSEHNKIFAGSFYYIIDYVEARFTYFSQSMKELLGISPDEGLAMHPAEYMSKAAHPEDLPRVLEIGNQFQEFCKEVVFEKLKDLRLVTTWRMKNAAGSYVKVVTQTCILSYSSNRIITSVFAGVSVAAFISDFEIATGAVIDATTGDQLASFSSKKTEAEVKLTKREIQILRLLAIGLKNKEVADRLHISVHTVETHRKHIMAKLEVSAAIDLVWKAIEYNLVQSP